MGHETDEADDTRYSLKGLFTPVAGERGMFVCSLVVKAAEEAISSAGEDSEEAKRLRKLGDEFISSFEMFAVDSEVERRSRTAALNAMLKALMIGMSVGDPKKRDEIILEFRRARTAAMRAVHEAKSAQENEAARTAVRAAMQGTNTKATRGVKYAEFIQPKVVEKLGRDVSPWHIRGHVRAILEETPRKSGKS
jgi:hypothetical protein